MKRILSAFFTFLFIGCGTYCDYLEELKNIQITGQILEINVYTWHKGEMYVHYIDSNEKVNKIYLGIDGDDEIRNFVKLGDSIFKQSNSLIVLVKKPNGENKYFDLTRPGCPKK